MARHYVTAGHEIRNGKGTGIIGYLDEAVEARRLVTEIAKDCWRRHRIMLITDNDTWSLTRVIRWLRTKLNGNHISLDVHFNAFNGKVGGTEAFVEKNATDIEKAFAYQLCKKTAKVLGIKNRGVKREDQSQHNRLGILHANEAAVNVLWEVCFGDNKNDYLAYRADRHLLISEVSNLIKITHDAIN